MPGFMLIEEKGTPRQLLNLDLVLGFIEAPDGNAVAVSVSGAQLATGQKFDEMLSSLRAMHDSDDEVD